MSISTNNDTDFKILVIDDNPAIHRDFIKILTASSDLSELDQLSMKMFGKKKHEDISLPNFKIDTASQGKEGVEYVLQSLNKGEHYSLAFVDIRMPPGWDGIETIKHIWELDKDVQIVICTAYSDYSWEETVANLGKTDNLLILKKPFDNVSVRQLACALTKKWQLLQDARQFTSSLKKQISDRTESLEKSLSLVKATLESSDEGIIAINEEKKITDCNQKFKSMWGITDNNLINKNDKYFIKNIQNKLKNPESLKTWLENIYNNNEATSIDIIELKDGRTFDCYSQPQIIDNKIVGRVLNFRDITERIHMEHSLQHQATHDSLTGLPNRVLLMDKLRDAIKNAAQSNGIFAVIFFDLDRFKLINDSLSHEAGDNLLCKTAERIRARLPEGDILGRLGGDEFVIITENIKTENDAMEKAKLLLSYFQEPFQIFDHTITVTSSIGVSIYPKNGETADALLRNADAAMYQAKESGSNNYQLYDEVMNSKSLDKLDKETQLRQAIINNEFFLCYQPEYDINNKKLISVEALIRWQHPTCGLILPIDFIPLAEETGLIIPIGEWVIRTACKQIKKLHDEGFPDIRVAINITSQQLKQQNIIGFINSVLKETKLDPKYVEFELTENIILSSIEIIRTVKKLKELGVSITIDDFGTGYSSLSYLKKIPLDRLKIDGSFIRNIQSETDDEVIIRAIIAFAKNLNLKVLAEGVETQDQLDFLKIHNCNEIQGYYFDKPLSLQELKDLMTTAEVRG